MGHWMDFTQDSWVIFPVDAVLMLSVPLSKVTQTMTYVMFYSPYSADINSVKPLSNCVC